MRSSSRHVIVFALFCVFGVGAVSSSGASSPARQEAVVYLQEPTLIGSTRVQGAVAFIHDEAKMARGEPCTMVQSLARGKVPVTVASFHCIPVRRPVVSVFTLTTLPNLDGGLGCVLVEYQFASDTVGHGVPGIANAH